MVTPSLSGYENLELIGKGGFSRVYRADQSKLKRKVAVKVLNFGLNEETDRLSFARETELMGRVSTHPNIVTVHDTAFTGEGQPCIVMEHYPGGSLADLINEVGRLTPREALDVGVAIASALEASHRSGILHCDLKPQNILISEFGQPALGDFGISTFAEERTRTGNDAGAGFTLPYAAPEVVEGDSPSAVSDVYSLAATLYTSLCGRRPFAYLGADGSKPTSAEHARRIMLEPVPSLVEDGVPPPIDALLAAAMAKDPADRPLSAALFASTCHEIGQALGYGTSAPRIADLGALPIIDSSAVGRGQVDLSRLIRERQDLPGPRVLEDPVGDTGDSDGPADRQPVDRWDEFSSDPSTDATVRRAEQQAEPVSDRRRQVAALVGVVATAVVVLLIAAVAAMNGGQDEPVAAPTPATESSAGSSSGVSAAIADPVVPPNQPTSVTLQRGEASVEPNSIGRVTASWEVPASDLEAGDVVYELRRSDGQPSSDLWPITTTSDQVDLPAIADDEGVCVTVLAVRGNRTATPTEPVCLTAEPVSVVLNPARCTLPCRVAVILTGGAAVEDAAAEWTVQILDRRRDEQVGSTMSVDSPSGGEPMTLDIGATAAPGRYLVALTAADGATETVLLTLDPPT